MLECTRTACPGDDPLAWPYSSHALLPAGAACVYVLLHHVKPFVNIRVHRTGIEFRYLHEFKLFRFPAIWLDKCITIVFS